MLHDVGFEGIGLGKWVKRKALVIRTPSNHSRRFNLSLVNFSRAELTSVSIEQCKFQFNEMYLQPDKKGCHLPKFKSISCFLI